MMATNCDTDELDCDSCVTINGVVFGCSVRAFYAVLQIGMEQPQEQAIVVKIVFQNDEIVTDLRSWCRRSCKMGDLLQIKGQWLHAEHDHNENDDNPQTRKHSRLVIHIDSLETANNRLKVQQIRYWNAVQCQAWQQKYSSKHITSSLQTLHPKKPKPERPNGEDESSLVTSCRHGGAMGKRQQSEYIANFLIHMVVNKLITDSNSVEQTIDPSGWATALFTPQLSMCHSKAIKALNQGSGVIDAAGGSGLVSMALGLAGVRSTVVDPRESVGRLPKRDRKLWNRACKNILLNNMDHRNDTPLCQPVSVMPFNTMRAWFATSPPQGFDPSFRHPDESNIPVCTKSNDLLKNCTAIVALHPDEATDAIVDMAVQHRIPFVVVPCCVFSRLFPHRRIANSAKPVCTYLDLLDYLAFKHEAIQRTVLPFEGANVALWAVF